MLSCLCYHFSDFHSRDAPHTSRKDRRNHATVRAFDAMGVQLGGKIHVPIPKDLGLARETGSAVGETGKGREGSNESESQEEK